MSIEPRTFLRGLLDAAIEAAQPDAILAPHLPAAPAGRTIVLGAGKAAAAMARAVERHMPGPIEGLVVTRYGHAVPCARVEVVEAAHPVPDAAGPATNRPAPSGLGMTTEPLKVKGRFALRVARVERGGPALV